LFTQDRAPFVVTRVIILVSFCLVLPHHVLVHPWVVPFFIIKSTQEEMARLETAASSSGTKSAPSSSARLNMDRYGVQAPSGKKEEKDEQVKLKKTQRKRRRKNIFALLFFFNFLYVF
jgi:hypothetical protein